MTAFLSSTVFLTSAASFVVGLWAGTRWPDLFSRVWSGLGSVWSLLASLPGRVTGLFKKS